MESTPWIIDTDCGIDDA
jgi:purine nucleosidase